MKVGRQIAVRNRIEGVVIAVDPVNRRAEGLVAASLIRDVADAQPERNVGVPGDDGASGAERAVDVAESAELRDFPRFPDYLPAGTSRSVLSQMKSLLL
jgi:hypothetical protein